MKTRLTVVLGATVLTFAAQGCGSKKEDSDKGAEKGAPAAQGNSAGDTAQANTAATAVKKELPPPPEDVYEGKARVINLAMKDGQPVAIDVWATQSFSYAPVKLAENVAFGEATEWFQSPKGSPVKAFVAGTPPDSEDTLGGVMHPAKGESITAMLYNSDDGSPTNGNYWDTSDDATTTETPDAPPAGKGYVVFRAGQLKPFEEAMTEVTGGWALRVGDGKEKCIPQRIEELGFQASLLGGTQAVEIDLEPGTHTITFHKGMKKGCTSAEKVYEISLEVKADTAQSVVLFTPDGKTLKHAVYDLPVNTAKPNGTNKKLKEAKDAERAAKKAAAKAANP